MIRLGLAAAIAFVLVPSVAARAQDLPSILTLLAQGFEIKAAYQGSIVMQKGRELYLCGLIARGGMTADAYIASSCVPFRDRKQ